MASGYKNSDKLAVASALAQSFKTGKDSKAPTRNGDFSNHRKGSSNDHFQPTSPVPAKADGPPPMAARNYKDAGAFAPQHGNSAPRQSILGQSGMDFIRRQDQAITHTVQESKPTASNRLSQVNSTTGSKSPQVVASNPHYGTTLPGLRTAGPSDIATEDQAEGAHAENQGLTKSTRNFNIANGSTESTRVANSTSLKPVIQPLGGDSKMGSNSTAPNILPQAAHSNSTQDAKQRGNAILETFFANAPAGIFKSAARSAANSTAPTPLINNTKKENQSPSKYPTELSRPVASVSPLSSTSGSKLNHAMSSLAQNSQSNLPGLSASKFAVQETTQSQMNITTSCNTGLGISNHALKSPSESHLKNPGENELCPKAKIFTPKQKDSSASAQPSDIAVPHNVQIGQSGAQPTSGTLSAGAYVFPEGYSYGQLCTVTEITFANGYMVPGQSTGRLMMQTPVGVVNPGIMHGGNTCPTNGTSPNTVPTPGGAMVAAPSASLHHTNGTQLQQQTPLANGRAGTAPEKHGKRPTKGLADSMWA